MRRKKEDEEGKNPDLDRLGRTDCCKVGAYRRDIYLHVPGSKDKPIKLAIIKVCCGCHRQVREANILDDRLTLPNLVEVVKSRCDWLVQSPAGVLVPVHTQGQVVSEEVPF